MSSTSTYPLRALTLVLITPIVYCIYQCFFHRLASFPGPLLAAVTDLWRFYHELRGDLPQVLHLYHLRYGPAIRVAPNEVDFNTIDVVDVVYKKGGRHYPKSSWYDGFTAIKPNIFGTQDEALHAVRRRQLAHGFSQKSLLRRENSILDKHLRALLARLENRAADGQAFDLSMMFRCYTHDVNMELALGLQSQTQAHNGKTLPPMNDHILLSKLSGYVPWLKGFLSKFGRRVPSSTLRDLLLSRDELVGQARAAAKKEIKKLRIDTHFDVDESHSYEASNLLTSLVLARDPETDEEVPDDEIASNALAFLAAGSHSTAMAIVFVFWHLVHHPQIRNQVVNELNTVFPLHHPADEGDNLTPYAGLEAALPYTSAVVKESFRHTPSVMNTMPRVTPDPGDPLYPTIVSGMVVPPATNISVSTLSLHRNHEIWGPDADEFDPTRWLKSEKDGGVKGKEGLLLHFGVGHRSCIGRNEALAMIWKATVEVLRRFEMRLPRSLHGEEGKMEVPVRVRGFVELEGPLMVEADRHYCKTTLQES